MCMVCLWCMLYVCICVYAMCVNMAYACLGCMRVCVCVCIHYTRASKDQEAIGYSFEEYVWARPGSQQAPAILLGQTATLTPTSPR